MDRLPGRGRRLVALDWDAHTLKAVEATIGKADLKIHRVISAQIPGDVRIAEADSFGAFIKRVLQDKKFGTRNALLAIPREKAILINLRLPTAPVGDLSGMVKLQASRELPFSVDEAVMDFAGSQAHDAPEFLDVTVGAIQRDALAYFRQLAAAAGLHLVRLGLRPNSNLLSVTRGVHPFTDDRILFVDIGAQTTEISIFRWGRLTFSRAVGVNVGTNAPAPEPTGRNLLMEVLRTVEAYRASDPNKLDQVIVAGDTGLEGWLVDALRTRFNTPTSLFEATWTVAIEKDRAEQMTGFCAVLGLLIGQTVPELGRFDFASPKRPVDIAAVRRRQAGFAGAAAAALILAVWYVSSSYIGTLEAREAQLTQDINRMVAQVQDGQKLAKRIEVAQKWMQGEIVWLDSIRQIVERLPNNEQGYVDRLLAKGQSRQIDLGLRFNDWRICNQLEEDLRNLGYQVELGNRSQSARGGYLYSGTLTVVIPPAKAAPHLPGRNVPASGPAQPVLAAETMPASPVVSTPQTQSAGSPQTQPARPDSVQAAR